MASIDFTLLSGNNEIKASEEFVTSCITFTNMFEDTGGINNSEGIPITDMFTQDEVNQFIKLYKYNLKYFYSPSFPSHGPPAFFANSQ